MSSNAVAKILAMTTMGVIAATCGIALIYGMKRPALSTPVSNAGNMQAHGHGHSHQVFSPPPPPRPPNRSYPILQDDPRGRLPQDHYNSNEMYDPYYGYYDPFYYAGQGPMPDYALYPPSHPHSHPPTHLHSHPRQLPLQTSNTLQPVDKRPSSNTITTEELRALATTLPQATTSSTPTATHSNSIAVESGPQLPPTSTTTITASSAPNTNPSASLSTATHKLAVEQHASSTTNTAPSIQSAPSQAVETNLRTLANHNYPTNSDTPNNSTTKTHSGNANSSTGTSNSNSIGNQITTNNLNSHDNNSSSNHAKLSVSSIPTTSSNPSPAVMNTAVAGNFASSEIPSRKGDIIFDPLPGVLPAERVEKVIKDRFVDIIVHGAGHDKDKRGRIIITQQPLL